MRQEFKDMSESEDHGLSDSVSSDRENRLVRKNGHRGRSLRRRSKQKNYCEASSADEDDDESSVDIKKSKTPQGRNRRPSVPESSDRMKQHLRSASPRQKQKGPSLSSSGDAEVARVGTRVYKRFDAGWFWGEVFKIDFDDDGKTLVYKVVYEDDDAEDFYLRHIKPFVRNANQKSPSESSLKLLAQAVKRRLESLENSSRSEIGDDHESELSWEENPDKLNADFDDSSDKGNARTLAERKKSSPSRVPASKTAKNSVSRHFKVTNKDDSDLDKESSAYSYDDDSSEESDDAAALDHASVKKPPVQKKAKKAVASFSKKPKIIIDESEEESMESDDEVAKRPSSATASSPRKRKSPHSASITKTQTKKPAAKKIRGAAPKAKKLKVEPRKAKPVAKNRKIPAAENSAEGYEVRNNLKAAYTDGDDLPIITEPQSMFDDMIDRLTESGENTKETILPLIEKLHDRPLRLATMCSGTESPILALDMIQKAISRLCENSSVAETLKKRGISTILPMEHVFSCEIEPFKQAYIERNFHPPILFRDIRELCNDQAYTAYGSKVDVPQEGSVDILIAGTSCVDYSNLNTKKKSIEDGGESGQTFGGMMAWIRKAKPPIVVIENVSQAPWDIKVELFEEEGYAATFKRLDTKKYYIPHTRQRGYLFAVRNLDCKMEDAPEAWIELVSSLERPASASLDAFMLANDDPRVIRGRARLTAESTSSNGDVRGDKAGRTDWTKCETRHHLARQKEALGDGKPLTNWSDSGSTSMPSFAFNEWVDKQVHRIHDLMDINTLRMASVGMDCTYKTMVWNLSQNVDRDTMGKLGLCQCITPTGVPYVTNRGGPLVGEELLLLQGIPADDLILTKESEENLKDLAGNAMSTTVVGAAVLSALIAGCDSLESRPRGTQLVSTVPCLVPRPLNPPCEVSIDTSMGDYVENRLELAPVPFKDQHEWKRFLEVASSSSRKCTSEGTDEALPVEELMICQDCGKTASRRCAIPPRSFEKHNFVEMERTASRMDPFEFRAIFVPHLPMQVNFDHLGTDQLSRPEGVEEALWNDWTARMNSLCNGQSVTTFQFNRLHRSHFWTAHYTSGDQNRLECRVSNGGVTWLLFLHAPVDSDPLRDVLEHPVARMRISPASDTTSFTLLDGNWELCLPTRSTLKLSIEGSGARVDSWRKRLGLKGDFEREEQFELLNIRVESESVDDSSLKSRIDGSYKILPDCGGACGSLRKKVTGDSIGGEEMYFFLESGRKSMPEDDIFVFSPDFHRTSYGEYREIDLHIDPMLNFRPLSLHDQEKQEYEEKVTAFVRGRWVQADKVRLLSSDQSLVVHCPKPGCASPLRVPIGREGWKRCPLLTSCTFSVEHQGMLQSKTTMELNLQKSKHVLSSVAFATSRLSLPFPLSSEDNDVWFELDRHDMKQTEGDDVVCGVCAPTKPPIHFREVRKGKTKMFLPIEDVEQAGIYERAMKNRPQPWIVRFSPDEGSTQSVTMSIGCNPVSLALNAFGRFPKDSVARKALIEVLGPSNRALVKYEWRVVAHAEKSMGEFPKLTFTSNKQDVEAAQPPNFVLNLRREQLRSLTWMLNQESSCEPFFEEEVEEAVLPSLNWRVEGSAKRPVLVRGGVIADEVGYGKTAITLGLIDSAPPPPLPPQHCFSGYCASKATLVIVPGHLMGQWPDEVNKFLGRNKTVVQIKNMQSFNKLTLGELMEADLVIANFTVLSSEKYTGRLARLSGINPDIVSHAGGRHFDDVYEDCVKHLPTRVDELVQSCGTVFASICADAKKSAACGDAAIRVDSKKSAYKYGSPKKLASKTKTNVESSERDPWGLSTKDVKSDYKRMTCPPLELFYWNRVVVDEFTYLDKKGNDRVRKIVHSGLQSNFRWFLSGTPRHSNFNDIQALSSLLGVHLGTDELLPGMKFGRLSKDNCGLEHLTQYLDIRSLQWHERRHKLAQKFLDRFVRQNVAEIDEIPFEDKDELVHLPPAERAIYLELDTHLKSLGMNSKQAIKSKKSSTGDRESRMQSVLKDSETGDEALLKYCCHFNFESDSTSALKTIDELIKRRESQKDAVAQEIVDVVAAAYRQRHRILKFQPSWASTKKTEKLEVSDALAEYLDSVDSNKSVTHGADAEIHAVVKELVRASEVEFNNNKGKKDDKYFIEAQTDDDSNDELNGHRGKKRKATSAAKSRQLSEDDLYSMKFALRNHMHKVRSLGKELCGRIRSLRYIKRIKLFQSADKCALTCPSCCRDGLSVQAAGVLSLCGHSGCLECLKLAASGNKCIDPNCNAHVSCSHIVSAADLGLHREEASREGKYGHKLSKIVEKVAEIIEQDRVIVFCQFEGLKAKVTEALNDAGIVTVSVSGSVLKQIEAVNVFQKTELEDGDPRVLLLKMDDQQSAGLNLTNLNHAVFVHPLLAATQQEYDAYETQAIGRIRRYGQQKKVYVWRFFADQTIDTELRDKFRPKKEGEEKMKLDDD